MSEVVHGAKPAMGAKFWGGDFVDETIRGKPQSTIVNVRRKLSHASISETHTKTEEQRKCEGISRVCKAGWFFFWVSLQPYWPSLLYKEEREGCVTTACLDSQWKTSFLFLENEWQCTEELVEKMQRDIVGPNRPLRSVWAFRSMTRDHSARASVLQPYYSARRASTTRP